MCPKARPPIPPEVRRILRREVHFGCPIEDCGSPFLSWHHFDPPWRVRPHFNPAGMIALCLMHHKMADQQTWTKQQLKSYKMHPYLNEETRYPKGRFHWKREQLLMLVGNNWYVSPSVILTVAGTPVIWLSKDQNGFEQLNLDIHDRNGKPILKMRDNDWEVYAPLHDLDCPPSAKGLSFEIQSEGLRLSMEFSDMDKARLFKKVEESTVQAYESAIEHILRTFSDKSMIRDIPKPRSSRVESNVNLIWKSAASMEGDNSVTLCTIEGQLVWPFNVFVSSSSTVVRSSEISVAGNIKIGGGLQILEDGGIAL